MTGSDEAPPAAMAEALPEASMAASPEASIAGSPEALGDASAATPLCPKCGAVYRGGDAACSACGLVVARMASYTAARDAQVPPQVHAAWARVTAAWNTAARHDELLQLVTAHHAYAWAAGRYRARGRDAVAQHQLARLRHTAEATLLASAAARPAATAKPYRAVVGVVATLIVLITAGLWYAMVVRDPSLSSTAQPIPVRSLTPGHPISPSTVK